MKKHLLLGVSLLLVNLSYSQRSTSDWSINYERSKSFIENKGQFDKYENKNTGTIHFAVDFGFSKIFFGESGVSYNFRQIKKKSKEERAKLINEPVKTFEDHKQKEYLAGKSLIREDEVSFKWVNHSDMVSLSGVNLHSDYHSYSYTNGNGEVVNVNYVKGYEKLVYKNIYPSIDIEYTVHPQVGVKYAFILHPGADVTNIDMLYDRMISFENESIHISTLFGDIVDHEPLTFYEDDKDQIIASSYVQNKNSVGFDLENYDQNRTVVIDPWVQTPNDPNSNWNCVWELDKDGAGNVYVIAGIMPMQLIKYNSAGALQWTHNTPYDTTAWLGTMATDDVGNSYVTNGTDYMIQKVDVNGNLVWNNNNPSGGQISTEFWNISFNCDETKLIVGGTGGNLDIHGKIYEVDMNSGDIVTAVQVTAAGNLFSIPPNIQEVRAMCPSPSGKYYFLTLDTIGYMSDNLTLCPAGSSSLVRDNQGIGWGYKCEDWRYNNTGIKAIRANDSYVYVNKGNELQQRSLVDFSVLNSANIPNGVLQSVFLGGNQSHNAGIDIDDCGNIYVGSTDGVYAFNSSLTQIGFYATSFKVWDVRVSTAGDIIACGGTGDSGDNNRSGGVQSFAASACSPMAFTCCNASVCTPDDMCVTDPSIGLVAETAGGTWSGPGVDVNGNFDPAIAGPGVHLITYTLLCGSETISITVDPCATIDICEEANGDLTASGGDNNYTWYEGTISTVTTPITTEQECIDCPAATPQYAPIFGFYTGCDLSDCTTQDTTWTQYATGVTTAPPSGYPIMIQDGGGTTTIINNQGELVACTGNPCTGVTITMNIDSQTDVSCFGGADGAATVSSSGGAAPYNYIWAPGSLSGNAQTGLSAGTYNIAIQDNNGCTGSGTVTITEPSELIASATSTPAACGANDGTATASATGGTGAYTYSWSPSGGTNATATGLAAGTYTVTVTDQNMCTDDFVIDVLTTNGPTISIDNSSNVSCFGANDGAADVSATGGTPGYTYSWMPGSLTGASQTGLAPDTYTVTVTDAGGCTDQVTVMISEPTQIVLSTSNIIDANCGANDGSATVDVVGGTGNYTYSWSPQGGTGATASNIPGGAYTVTVTDDSGCSEVINLTVPTLGGPTVTVVSTTDVSCFELTDGAGEISATGGSAPYTYSWAPSGGTSNIATGLGAGTYTVTVTDAGGCVSTVDVTITEPTPIIVAETITDEDCGISNGAISLSVSGGTPGYTYLWSPGGETTSSISGLSNGTYDVTVTDANGCTYVNNFAVNQIGGLAVDASPELTVIDEGESVQLNVTGATTYSWDPPIWLSCSDCSDPIASPTTSTVYIVTGTDANGCFGIDTIEIIVNPAPENCGSVYVPNVFSPNNNNNNDYLCVYGDCIAELQFMVYNRWGEKVFESSEALNVALGNYDAVCWDGTHRGKPLNSGTYVYRIYATLLNGDAIEDSGNITLVR